MDRKSLFSACAFFLIIAGCGPTTHPSDDSGPGFDAYTPPGVDAFVPGSDAFVPVDGFIPPPDAGPPGCTSDGDCIDDGDCTTDTCVIATGICRNTVTPALCAAGESCNPVTGDCEMGRACATDADCADTDACTTMERCDPAARVCTFQPLDGDMDGDPPRVCGGGDCDDSRSDISSLDGESCNSLDDDCDTRIDEDFNFDTDPLNCGACRRTCVDGICAAGECACTGSDSLCTPSGRSAFCTDLSTDSFNCGTCGRWCPPDTGAGGGGTSCDGARPCPAGEGCFGSGVCRPIIACVDSACACPGGTTACSGACVDRQTDINNCGTCGHICPATTTCVAGSCVCTAGQTLCDGFCSTTSEDELNCGGCRVLCGGEGSGVCTGGLCEYLFRCPSPPTSCGGRDVCTFYDPRNCGGCGVTCPTGVECLRGVCGS
jgi:hypothetical protein